MKIFSENAYIMGLNSLKQKNNHCGSFHFISWAHRDRSKHIEIERGSLAVFTFAKLGCFVIQICFFIVSLLLNFLGSGS